MYFPTIMRSYLEPQNPRNQGSHDPKNAPVEVGSLSHYLRRVFLHPNGGCLGFLNHQQYNDDISHIKFPIGSMKLVYLPTLIP